ncbi:helix-turn-helix domain-containing protein [Nakamurella flavida]|uniref:Helix-turn-helix domain-containing protein n=1 Tax=Nakamurella flavida TaxID=363630 RepID=A0A938YIL6_9ACTN|nr:helix-turn-helix transcriptional regulator [Nakamurella flavida]MBM9475794.1 helix-turn-helix domain-containing protein [Nakamurella flavida]MDP9777925.1 transcriptional regulator with XRE-family HTH domain [Nakamurella flavida]
MSDQEAARTALREYLTTRRGRITPADAGLPVSGRRRVPGLRREEVAMLAGISPEYYVRLERGAAAGISPEIVDTVAMALRLDGDERMHLDRLIAALTPAARRRRRPSEPDAVSPGIQVMLDALQDLPAVVFNGRLDIVAVNDLGRALYDSHFTGPDRPNAARFLFLDEDRARRFWPEWEKLAADVVAILRVQAGVNPDDPALVELIGQLSTRSAEFRTRWAAHDVRAHRSGVKRFDHPLLGQVALPTESMSVVAATDHILTVFTPRPGTPEHDALRLLASWNADRPAGAPVPRS